MQRDRLGPRLSAHVAFHDAPDLVIPAHAATVSVRSLTASAAEFDPLPLARGGQVVIIVVGMATTVSSAGLGRLAAQLQRARRVMIIGASAQFGQQIAAEFKRLGVHASQHVASPQTMAAVLHGSEAMDV